MKKETRDLILLMLACGASFSTILVWVMVALHTGFAQTWTLTTIIIGISIHIAYMFILVKIRETSGKEK